MVYIHGTLPIKQPRGLLIQGWHYTTVSEAVIIALIPWCSISLLEDHCLIHKAWGLNWTWFRQFKRPATRVHQRTSVKPPANGDAEEKLKMLAMKCLWFGTSESFFRHHSQECTRDHQGHQHTVYNMFDVRYSQTEAFKLLGKKEWADQSDFTTLLSIILVASFLGRSPRSCLFEFSILLFSYELSLYIKYTIQSHTHM